MDQKQHMYRGIVRCLVRGQRRALDGRLQLEQQRARIIALSRGTARGEPTRDTTPRGSRTHFFLPAKETSQLRGLVASAPADHVADVLRFLTHQQQYESLKERYTTSQMSQVERVAKTANRVGLSVPETQPPTSRH
ncbi:Fmc1p KNAG_0A05270 [Huiozyma naganishii CBS 8797]|uniref:Uncharacterized protein n=1 Tax=Huiozyma naganishii (strain ATCC MYA-139 / BCRC 22969 / CBS 8797 / KCTC 17520 / NBRC 10181 / NCYC 3082 / Yp74L-3) TaxID=1071383 RepID=J7RF53_HUIN7|nr:hypothetical protein KNAG_0A05270 [Kazachstania naganishii CBS 8797]CCK68193.1 hypothetical protein KNAG_0A05270 [Kazachstania naganishii CBS 8797]